MWQVLPASRGTAVDRLGVPSRLLLGQETCAKLFFVAFVGKIQHRRRIESIGRPSKGGIVIFSSSRPVLASLLLARCLFNLLFGSCS